MLVATWVVKSNPSVVQYGIEVPERHNAQCTMHFQDLRQGDQGRTVVTYSLSENYLKSCPFSGRPSVVGPGMMMGGPVQIAHVSSFSLAVVTKTVSD